MLTTNKNIINDTIKIIESIAKINTNTNHIIQYFNITGCNGLYLAKLPRNIKVGDTFNVYCFDEVKFGCEWLGNLKQSLINFVTSDFYVEYFENRKKQNEL